MGNNSLADKIHSDYILPFIRRISSVSSKEEEESSTEQQQQQEPVAMDRSPSGVSGSENEAIKVGAISGEFKSLYERFVLLTPKIRRAFKQSKVSVQEVQELVQGLCGIPPLPQEQATFDAVFDQVMEECSILNFNVLSFLVENLLKGNKVLRKEISNLKLAVDQFNSSAKMVELVGLIKHKQVIAGDHKILKLKVREFWSQFTMKQFETVINEILDTLYDRLSHITVGKGCICVSWVIPDHINASMLVPELSLEFVQIIGVISLHIGGTVIYDIGGEGCETIEAAMLQAIELKNTRAIELLLAVGCNPEVATYHIDNAVTTIVNIREKSQCDDSSGSGGTDHVCILGHNEHVEAIVDPSREPECSSCKVNAKMMKNLQQETVALRQQMSDTLAQQKKKEDFSIEFEKNQDAVKVSKLSEQLKRKDAEITKLMEQLKSTSVESSFIEQLKIKDAEIILLKKENQALIKELNVKGNEETAMLKKEMPLLGSSTAVISRQTLGIGAEMKVKVITRDRSGKKLENGGLVIKALLACNREECSVTDNGNGTYLVSVIPERLGKHQLYITVNGQFIQDKPFILNIIPQCDYSKLNNSTQASNNPQYIAFSDNGDMFVTSSTDHCIYVYDESGNVKTTIGSEGSGELQFKFPRGIDINGEVVYVAENGGHRIHMLTTGGEFISTFGEQLDRPCDVKISPDGKIYVALSFDDRVQVFNPDWTISHVIEGRVSGNGRFSTPEAIAFDLSGDVHVTGYGSSSVTVFTPNGEFVRRYHVLNPTGIAIDPSGYSLVACRRPSDSELSVYDPNGMFICSVEGFTSPTFYTGVSISPDDGSVFVADTGNELIVSAARS